MSVDNAHEVECEEDIRWLYEAGYDRPHITCGYCGARTRRRTAEAAISWFHDHEFEKPAAKEYGW